MSFSTLLLGVGLGACSDDGSGVTGNAALTPAGSSGAKALAKPNFVFSPQDPGRAVGIRAIVTVDGRELTTDPLELTLSAGSGTATRSASAASLSSARLEPKSKRSAPRNKALTTCPGVGDHVKEMGTINGNVCYLAYGTSTGQLGQQRGVQRTLYFAREGIYDGRSIVGAIYVPPDLFSLGLSVSVGCLPGDGDGVITVAYLDQLKSLSISFSLMFYAAGFSVFTIPGRGPVRGIQYDTGVSYSAGGILGFVPLPVSFSYSIQVDLPEASPTPPPTFLRPWKTPDVCGSELGDENSMEYIQARLQELEGDAAEGGELGDALAGEIARGAGPLFASLGSPGQGGLGPNVPAASNADFYAEFLSNSGTELPDDALDTSADGIGVDFVARTLEAGDNPSALLAAAARTSGQVSRSVPSVVSQAALTNEAVTALQASSELSELAEMTVPDAQRFIARDIRRLTVPAGEQAHVELPSQEVADLLQRPVADVVGATVRVNAGASIQNAPFVLGPQGLALNFDLASDNLLVRFDVDLSTADGDFPADVADWVVRPALRALRVEAGPANAAFLTGPPSLLAGAPASLSVQVLDANGKLVRRPYDVRFVDSEGSDLGNAEAAYGTALLQYVPEASTPRITTVAATTITYQGGSFPGLSIQGTSFSEELEVSIDAGAPLELGSVYQVESPEEVLLILPDGIQPGEHTLHARNPEGLAVNASFSVNAP